MESTVGHKQIRIKSFTGKSEDWMDWKAKFQAVLHIEKLRKALTQTRPTDNETLIAAWEVNNENIYHQLVLCTEGSAAGLAGHGTQIC